MFGVRFLEALGCFTYFGDKNRFLTIYVHFSFLSSALQITSLLASLSSGVSMSDYVLPSFCFDALGDDLTSLSLFGILLLLFPYFCVRVFTLLTDRLTTRGWFGSKVCFLLPCIIMASVS
jgi:hypothetical protein